MKCPIFRKNCTYCGGTIEDNYPPAAIALGKGLIILAQVRIVFWDWKLTKRDILTWYIDLLYDHHVLQVSSSFQSESSFAAWWRKNSVLSATEVFPNVNDIWYVYLSILIEMTMIQKVQEISIQKPYLSNIYFIVKLGLISNSYIY